MSTTLDAYPEAAVALDLKRMLPPKRPYLTHAESAVSLARGDVEAFLAVKNAGQIRAQRYKGNFDDLLFTAERVDFGQGETIRTASVRVTLGLEEGRRVAAAREVYVHADETLASALRQEG